MSEFNFDKLKNYEAPDEWADKTIDSAKVLKVQIIHRKRKVRIAILCICFIIFCMMSFTFCLQILGETIITPVNTEETTSTKKSPDSYMDNIIYVEKTENPHTEAVETTEKETVTKTLETEKPTQQKVESSEIKSENNKKPTTAVKPTKKPSSQKPTTTVNKQPDNNSNTIIEPTETPIEYRVICSTNINKSALENSEKIYCRVYSCDEDKYLGDDDIYSSEHIAEIYGENDIQYYIRYLPVKNGVIKENGEYIISFYDENGKNLKVFGYTVKEF